MIPGVKTRNPAMLDDNDNWTMHVRWASHHCWSEYPVLKFDGLNYFRSESYIIRTKGNQQKTSQQSVIGL